MATLDSSDLGRVAFWNGAAETILGNHVQNILARLSLHSRLEAVACANPHGLL